MGSISFVNGIWKSAISFLIKNSWTISPILSALFSFKVIAMIVDDVHSPWDYIMVACQSELDY